MTAADQKKSLTQPPENLREAIDWLTWVCHYGKGSKDYKSQLAAAVTALTDFKAAFKGKFGTVEDPTGFINKLGKGLGEGFLGYHGQGIDNFSGDGIVKKGGGYESAYRDAQWQDGQKSDYVEIFLAAAPFVFWSLAYLYLRCKIGQTYGGWADESLNVNNDSGIRHFMSSMGFIPSQFKDIRGSSVAHIFDSDDMYSLNEFKKAYDFDSTYYSSSYPKFIKKLEENGLQNPIDRPLACSYLLSKYYCEYLKQQQQETTEIFANIRKKLENSNYRGIIPIKI